MILARIYILIFMSFPPYIAYTFVSHLVFLEIKKALNNKNTARFVSR